MGWWLRFRVIVVILVIMIVPKVVVLIIVLTSIVIVSTYDRMGLRQNSMLISAPLAGCITPQADVKLQQCFVRISIYSKQTSQVPSAFMLVNTHTHTHTHTPTQDVLAVASNVSTIEGFGS